MLERATRAFKDEARYANDLRYLKLWVAYADLLPAPGDVFAFLYKRKIGEDLSLFWVAWAWVRARHCSAYGGDLYAN